jgi:hypothetical protein
MRYRSCQHSITEVLIAELVEPATGVHPCLVGTVDGWIQAGGRLRSKTSLSWIITLAWAKMHSRTGLWMRIGWNVVHTAGPGTTKTPLRLWSAHGGEGGSAPSQGSGGVRHLPDQGLMHRGPEGACNRLKPKRHVHRPTCSLEPPSTEFEFA